MPGSTQEEKIAFLQEMGIESTGLDKLIKASYELLGLISFLTDGKKGVPRLDHQARHQGPAGCR